ncbi:hypothetical protein [Kribbella deserti]|uniref:Lipoprotein n=1 Tax=Kribbella deserti TaxID=1926257 RepID=A0ABV6QHX7_9ACTN
MRNAISLFAALALVTGLTACGASTYNVPYCVDDALILPAGKNPKPSGTSRSSRPKTYNKPSTTRTKTNPHGYGYHHDDHDCD